MIMDTEIEVGDIVSVNFNTICMTLMIRGEVLCVPCATGDSWKFRSLSDNSLHYVSEGCTVSLVEKHTQQGVKKRGLKNEKENSKKIFKP